MPLLNYTSKVPAHESIAEISRLLAKAGARQIIHDYDDAGNIEALSFSLELEGQRLGFRLPTDWRPVQQMMFEVRQKNGSGTKRVLSIRRHGARADVADRASRAHTSAV